MRVAIIGGALALTSSLKVEDIGILTKYAPDALRVKDEEGNDVFAVTYNEGNPSINNKGIVFSGTSLTGEGNATLTVNIDTEGETGVEAIKDAVADIIAVPAKYLAEIEAAAPAVLADVAEKRAQLKNSIQVLG